MKEIIIYGGGFNPPTCAHVEIMKQCLDEPDIDEVWAMPCGERLDKGFTTTDEQRLEMLDIVKETEFKNDDRLVVSNFDLELPRPTMTIQTLGALGLSYPDTKFWFAFGTDAYHSMNRWQDGEFLQKNLSMYILPRDDEPLPNAPNIRLLTEVKSVSSTLVRKAIAADEPFEHFVPAAIATYISQERLYRPLPVQ